MELSQLYRDFERSLGLPRYEPKPLEVQHAELRRMLCRDAAMEALMTYGGGGGGGVGLDVTIGVVESLPNGPFRVDFPRKLLLVSPTLLNDAAALSAAVRWGLECCFTDSVTRVVLHGRSLLRTLTAQSRSLLISTCAPHVRLELLQDNDTDLLLPVSLALLEWQKSCALDWPVIEQESMIDGNELSLCLEEILVRGGDTRLRILENGFNRYGTLPRPRPEAVHFSSSTASCISQYGFFFCEHLRRCLLRFPDSGNRSRRQVLANAISIYLRGLAGLDEGEADVVLGPSGTDMEILALLTALAHGCDQGITNILISPEETGRGVKFAAAGKFYDICSPTGKKVAIGEDIWPNKDISVVSIPIRESVTGAPLAPEVIQSLVESAVEEAIAAGRHVLLHLLACSKTGLQAPTERLCLELHRRHGERLDVVVDACQMRSPVSEMAMWVRSKWLVQVSGSKFLTGPAFSGAMFIPAAFRSRADQIKQLSNPNFCWTSDWAQMSDLIGAVSDEEKRHASFGYLFRWLPALLEADLFSRVSGERLRDSFQRFRHAILTRLQDSPILFTISDTDTPLKPNSAQDFNLANDSIVCFSILVDGQALNEDECRKLFMWLNTNVTHLFDSPLNPLEAALARTECHIGQPVSMMIQQKPAAVLRMVLGARFFTMMGTSGTQYEAALQSEISDALRAIAKIEFLARNWSILQKKNI